MNILLVEDEQKHIDAAKATLKEHNVIYAESFDEASDVLMGAEVGREVQAYHTSRREDQIDVVLTDLFLPQGRGVCQADRSKRNELQPFGYAIAMMALKDNIQYIGMLSDTDHHQDAMAYTLDFFKYKVQDIGNSRTYFGDSRNFLLKSDEGEYLRYGEFTEKYPGVDTYGNSVKNYARVLEVLVSGNSDMPNL